MTHRIVPLVSATLFAFATLFSASADQVVTFPDVMTTNLVYSSIEESNNSIISGQTLFGGISPQVPGDELRLQATAFSLSNPGGVGFLTGNFDATITAKPGVVINSITIRENGSAMTYGADAIAFANLDATVIVGGGFNLQDSVSYTKTGAAGLPNPEMWNLSVSFNFSPTNEVLLSIRNDLLVDGTPGVASIGKDKIQIIVGTTITTVPEPSSALAIMAFGVAGTTLRRRRS